MEAEKERHKVGHHKKNISKKFSLYNFFIGLTLLLGIILVLNIILTFNLNKDLKKSAEAAKEATKPAKIELTVVKNSKCSDCFDVSAVVNYIKSANVNITKEDSLEFDSKGAKDAINKYKIEKIPALIVTGEIGKVNIQGMEKEKDALLFKQTNPPFTNALTGKIEGRVILYNLKDLSCNKCNNLTILINQVKAAGVKIVEEKLIEPGSDEGKELIKKYRIGFVPTIVLSEDAGFYELIKQAWSQIGTREVDGYYVFRGGIQYPNLPFINLTTGKLRGLINIIYLTDKSCADCYEVNQHKQILANSFAIKIDKEETYDISDAKGKELITKYNITQVPTVILSNEISAYPSIQVLKQFFSVEKDNAYVFRMLSTVGTYRDLAANQVVKAQQISQEQ